MLMCVELIRYIVCQLNDDPSSFWSRVEVLIFLKV